MLKYQRWYDQIVERGRFRALDCYKERHHINPRSFGGTDDDQNLVDLTYREHFLVHWLLTKICVGRQKRLMVHALHSMTMGGKLAQRIVAGWQYEVAKRNMKAAVLERKRERERINRRRAEDIRHAQIKSLKASGDITKLILEMTPWKAKQPQTVLAARAAIKEMIAEAVPLIQAGPGSRKALSELSKVWIQCSHGGKRLNRHRKRRIEYPIQISPADQQRMRGIVRKIESDIKGKGD
jgi:hypothetical protein